MHNSLQRQYRSLRLFPDNQTAEELNSDETVRQTFEQRISERLASVSHYEQLGKFTLLDKPFTVESGELTPKLTLRRDVICARCRDKIDAMYDET